MNRNMKIAFLFAVCAVSVVSFCGEAEAASGVFETLRQKTATFASQLRFCLCHILLWYCDVYLPGHQR